jgi:ACR3 family arsenite transporter
MMLKVDFQSIKNVGKNPKGLFVTWITNWLIKPFTMFGIAWLFFYVVFKLWIPEDLAKDYLAGAILLGAAPCTAMVFVWSHLTKGIQPKQWFRLLQTTLLYLSPLHP